MSNQFLIKYVKSEGISVVYFTIIFLRASLIPSAQLGKTIQSIFLKFNFSASFELQI